MDVDAVVRALQAGELAVLPTDTVYGLVCTAASERAASDLYRLKGRDAIQPTAIIAASVDALLEALPELAGPARAVAEELLPGPYTLVVPNPAHRFAWLTPGRPDTVGVRVPDLPQPTAAIVAAAGAVVATSANLPGGPDPRRLDEVPESILAGVAAAVDGGALPGTPSTVLTVSGEEPRVIRAGAGDVDRALAVIGAAFERGAAGAALHLPERRSPLQ